MKKQLKSTLALLATTLMAGVAQASPADFLGTWRNANPNTKGIVQVVVGPGLQIRNFGACTPTPCDMGNVPLTTYGLSITDRDHKAATAHYNLSFKQVEVVVKVSGRTMILESYNKFTDNSGRQNYWSRERLIKTSAEPTPPLSFQNAEPLD